MDKTRFTENELLELEALEVRGGSAASMMAAQRYCTNESEYCGSGVDQDYCTNADKLCGSDIIHPTQGASGCSGDVVAPPQL